MPPRKGKPGPEQTPLFEQIAPETPARSAIEPDMLPAQPAGEDQFVPIPEVPETEPVSEPEPEQKPKPAIEAKLTPTEKERQRLLGYKALLGTFGRMNVGENYLNRFNDSPGLVRTSFKQRGLDSTERQAESEDTAVTLEDVARSQVYGMLGLKALVETKVITDKQAGAVRDATYDHYSERYLGIGNKKARASQLGKVNRRIQKLERKQ